MSFGDYSLTFSGAGERPIQAIGRFLRIREADSDVYIRYGSRSEIKRLKGEQIDFGDFYRKDLAEQIVIRSLIAQTIELVVSDTPQDDNRQAVSLSTTTTLDSSNNTADAPAVSVAATSSAQLVTSNGNRIELEIAVSSDEIGGVWVGGSTIANQRGVLIEPGMSRVYSSDSEWWAYNPNASAVLVQVLELERL